jgi:hypothetical protein
MPQFPAPKDSEYPWIGAAETSFAHLTGMDYLIAHRDRIEVLGGWKTSRNEMVHFAERAVVSLANKETTEVEYFSVLTIANCISYKDAPSPDSVWKLRNGPMTRDELVAQLTTGSPGDLLLLPWLTDTALGFIKLRPKPPLRNCWIPRG